MIHGCGVFALWLLLTAGHSFADTITGGTVVGVTDGDTVVLPAAPWDWRKRRRNA